jgi:hypothetical protein
VTAAAPNVPPAASAGAAWFGPANDLVWATVPSFFGNPWIQPRAMAWSLST